MTIYGKKQEVIATYYTIPKKNKSEGWTPTEAGVQQSVDHRTIHYMIVNNNELGLTLKGPSFLNESSAVSLVQTTAGKTTLLEW